MHPCNAAQRSICFPPLRLQRSDGFAQQVLRNCPRSLNPALIQSALERGIAHDDLVREAHSVCGKHPGQGVDENASHAERIGHLARVLASRAAEALQRVAADIVAAHDGDALHGIGHAAHGNLYGAARNLLGLDADAGGRRHLPCQFGEAAYDHVPVQWFVGQRAKDSRKECRLNTAKQYVCIGDGKGAAASIARGAGIGAGGFRAHSQPRTVEANDGTAAGRDAVNAHHGRAHPHASDFGVEGSFVFAGKMAHVGGRAAHVEADEP